jgi:hypothetical protein
MNNTARGPACWFSILATRPARCCYVVSCLLRVDREADARVHLVLAYCPPPIPPSTSLREGFNTSILQLFVVLRSLMSNRRLINNFGRVQNANFGYNSGEVFRRLNQMC